MASVSNDLLRSILIKYAGVPSKEAILVANELDELRQYDTEAALLADLANVRVGSFAYAIDTDAVYLRGASAFTLVASPQADASAFQQAQTMIPATEIKALAATQKTLVPAVAGKVNVLHDLAFQLDAGSEVLAAGAGDDLIVNYVDAAGVAATGSIETTGFLDQAADTFQIVKGVAIPAGTIAQLVNTPLVLDNTGVEFTGNASDDAQLIVWTRYSQITVV